MRGEVSVSVLDICFRADSSGSSYATQQIVLSCSIMVVMHHCHLDKFPSKYSRFKIYKNLVVVR